MNSDESYKIILSRLSEEMLQLTDSLGEGRGQLAELVRMYYEIERDNIYEPDRQAIQDKVRALVEDFERRIWGEDK